MKKIVALFSVLAMFSIAALAQDPPKNTVKPTVNKQKTLKAGKINNKKVTPGAKAKKATLAGPRITK